MDTSDEKLAAVEFGWRVHAALESWTSKVDVKASIALAIQAAAFGLALSLTSKGALFYHLTFPRSLGEIIGMSALGLSVLASTIAVFPRLRGTASKRAWQSGMIYFGHLRRWDPHDLAQRLHEGESSSLQLANQLVVMSKIAWAKHVWLQWSLGVFLGGSILLFLVGIF